MNPNSLQINCAAEVHELPDHSFVRTHSADESCGTIGEVHDEGEAVVEEHILDCLEVRIRDSVEHER